MSVPWWASKALLSLEAEVNSRWPTRDRSSDGMIGDPRHQAEQSDHNPLPDGEVCAWDITADAFAPWLAQHLADLALAGDPRVKYIIWQRQIFNLTVSPNWRPYTGADPHFSHIHLSVNPHSAATPDWGVAQGDDMPLNDDDKAWIAAQIKTAQDTIITHIRPQILAELAKIEGKLG